MTTTADKVTTLNEIFKPLFEYVVIEFNIPGETKSGIKLHGQAAKDHQMEMTPVMQVVAVGSKADGTPITNVKVGDYVLPSPRFNPHQVPLLYKNSKEGIQHAQIHISEIMGIVDTDFAIALKSKTTAKTVVN